MIAAIEIYNKPTFQYREECTVILLLNAWELLLKAVLSKNKESIYYPKERNQPYRTYSWQDAFNKATVFIPARIQSRPLRDNLDFLGTYRDNAVHFYNEDGFETVVYALAQTSISNFRDVLYAVFDQRLEEEISWKLLPLGIEAPLDIVQYMSDGVASQKKDSAVGQFLSELASAADDLIAAGADTGRLMTIFNVKLESVKKIGEADLVVGIGRSSGDGGPLVVTRTQDPNVTHPLRQKEVVETFDGLHGRPFTQFTFQAIAWKHDLKNRRQYCWRAKEGVLTRYSRDVITFITRLSSADLDAALTDYRQHLRAKHKRS